MIRHHRLTTAVLALLLPAIGACGNQGTTQPKTSDLLSQQSADRVAIENIIQTSADFDVAFTDDGGELLAQAPSAVSAASGAQSAQMDSTATLPVHWGRWRIPPDQPPTRTVDFLMPPDSGRVLVKINVKYDGWFFVDRTDDGVRNPGKKLLQDKKTRYALFKKIWFHEDGASTDSVFGWRLIALSPGEFTMIDPARQSVHISKVELTGEHSHVTITDPAALLPLGRTPNLLPFFRSGETVKVEASVTNTDTGFDPATYVFLHVPIADQAFPNPRQWQRLLMLDDGTHGDATAGDGVFTAMWTVSNVGRHHVAVDVLNARILQNETDDDYNSTAWGVPYGSYPSLLP